MYLAVCTRPDIAYTVSAIARMSDHTSKKVCNAVNHLFAYLIKNRVVFRREKVSEVTCLSDSDYTGVEENDYKYTPGIRVTLLLGLTIISWYSSKQATTAQSSSDAECIAMKFASKQVL
jgi:hypothetical protein